MRLLETPKLKKQSPDPFYRNHLLRDAINQALYEEMERDPSIHLMGEGAWVKQRYDAPRILERFRDRIITMPICEDGSTNFAVGTSLLGIKPVVDVIGSDFLYRTLDSICNTAAKLNMVLGPGRTPSTIVIRAEFLLGGPTSGQRPEALFTHIPGLRVVVPSTPHDAYGLMRTALTTPGVTLFFEDRMISDEGLRGTWNRYDLETRDPMPFGTALARLVATRTDAPVVVTYGVMRQLVERILVADDRDSAEADLIDLISLYPIDWGLLERHLLRSPKLLIVEPDVQYGGIGAEIAAQIAERMPYVRIKRLGAKRQTVPASMALHAQVFPSEEEIIHAIRSFDTT